MTDKKKYVLQLCHGYAPPFLDVARQYAVLFKNTDYQVITVYLTGKTDNQVAKDSASDTVIFLENTSRELRGMKRKQIRQVKDITDQYSFDFVIAHRYKAIFIACHIKNLKVIGVHHAYDDYVRFTRRWFVYRQKNRLQLLGVSNAIRDNLRKLLPHFPQQQIQTLYNRIDPEALQSQQLTRAEARNALGLTEQRFYFVNVGRLHPDKDQHTLIRAFAEIARQSDDVGLMIYGKGRLQAQLQQLVDELQLGDKVVITSKAYIAHYLRAFDCFVLSSDHEPFGMVLLEAMAAQLPVISTAEGGAGEVVGDSGLLFNLRDSQQLTAHMQTMLNMNNPDIEQMKHRMHSRLVDYFTDQQAAKTFKHLFL